MYNHNATLGFLISDFPPICQLASASTSSAIASRVGDSPANMIENKSKCYHQLAELKNLMESLPCVKELVVLFHDELDFTPSAGLRSGE